MGIKIQTLIKYMPVSDVLSLMLTSQSIYKHDVLWQYAKRNFMFKGLLTKCLTKTFIEITKKWSFLHIQLRPKFYGLNPLSDMNIMQIHLVKYFTEAISPNGLLKKI